MTALEVENDKKISIDNLFFTIINTKVVRHMVMHLLTMKCEVETSNIPVFKIYGVLLLHLTTFI